MAKLTLGEKATRVLRMLMGLRNARIAAAMAAYGLTDADLTGTVTIRQQELTVHAALCRSLAHVSYHVGQLVLLARMLANQPWQYLSIPKGESDAYNANATLEKAPR